MELVIGRTRRALSRLSGMDEKQGKAPLTQLIADATKEAYTYLHRWRPGDVVMWDNRASIHWGRP